MERARVASRSGSVGRQSLTRHRGDAMSAADVAWRQPAFPIVHAVNPPGYRNGASWCADDRQYHCGSAPPARTSCRAPSTISGRTPSRSAGNVAATPGHRQGPDLCRDGAALARRRPRVSRPDRPGGRFFDPGRATTGFPKGWSPANRSPRSRTGPARIGHQWAYLPDVAETMVRLWKSPTGSRH